MKLNPTHYLAIDMLASGESNISIAEKLSVAPETISKWRGDLAFQSELNSILKATQEAAIARLHSLSTTALETIEKIMVDKEAPHKDRLTASVKVLELLNIRTVGVVESVSENNELIINILPNPGNIEEGQ